MDTQMEVGSFPTFPVPILDSNSSVGHEIKSFS